MSSTLAMRNELGKLLALSAAALVAVVAFAVLPFSAQAAINGVSRVDAEGGGGGDVGGGTGGGTTPATTQCNDGIDNDSNGRTDYPSDLGCTSGSDTTEAGYVPPTQCGDGIDNDSNGFVDYPNDLGCTAASDTTESGYVTQCKDGIDNDGNGVKDYPADAGCSAITDTTEAGYVPPPTPPPGIIVYKTASKRDYYNVVQPDQMANGGVNETSAHGAPQYPSSQVSPTGSRICYLYDPTAFITEWTLGGFDSPGNNSMAAWNPSTGKWYRASANSFQNKRYNYLTCKTNAPPDTSLTASATSVVAGTPVTLTWLSRYGQLRKGTFTSENFSLTTTIPGHNQVVTDFICDPGNNDDGWNDNYNTVMVRNDSNDRGLTAGYNGCWSQTYTEWVPESTVARPYGGSTVVTPTVTTTYRYRGTNANGSSVSSVTVVVTGTTATQCADGVDNDNEGDIDLADPGCSSAEDTTEAPNPVGVCANGVDDDGDNLVDMNDPGCNTDTDGDGDADSETGGDQLSCTPSSQTVSLGGSVTYVAAPSNLGTYTWTPVGSGINCEAGTGSSKTCTFSTPGSYQMSVSANGYTSGQCSPSVTAQESCSASQVTFTADAYRVAKDKAASLDWNTSGGCICDITGTNGFASSEPTGTNVASTITKQTDFTMTCNGGVQKSLRIEVAFPFRDF